MKMPTFFTSCAAAAVLALPSWGATPVRDQIETIAFAAMTTDNDAGKIQSYNSDGLDWMAQGGQLMVLRDDLNHLGQQIQQLQSEALPTGEQRLVRRVAREVNLISVYTENAITFGKMHRDDLFNPVYTQHISRIYSNAEQLNHDAKAVLRFANGVEGNARPGM